MRNCTQGKNKAYTMALERNDRTKGETITMWTLDTSKWNPKNVAFEGA